MTSSNPSSSQRGAPIARGPFAIARAVELLKEGGLIGMPTETVYGLAGDAESDAAIARIFAAKNRPRFNPLIIHFANTKAALKMAPVPEAAHPLIDRFWPGPLTLIVPRPLESSISYLASAGLDTLAIRVPAHPVAQALLKEFGRPLAAPSANPSGRISPTLAAHVQKDLGDAVALILEGGPSEMGVESTIVDVSQVPFRLLRHGAIPLEEIEAIAGPLVNQTKELSVRAPGMLWHHYAPDRPLRIDVKDVKPTEALLAFGPAPLEGAAITANLSPSGNLTEAAANLFRMLHQLDRPDFSAIAVMPIPDQEIGRAINDRLRRAAAPRMA